MKGQQLVAVQLRGETTLILGDHIKQSPVTSVLAFHLTLVGHADGSVFPTGSPSRPRTATTDWKRRAMTVIFDLLLYASGAKLKQVA